MPGRLSHQPPICTGPRAWVVLFTILWAAHTPATSSLEWSTYLGGSDGEAGAAIARVNGNVVLVGHTTSDDFPVTQNAHDPIRDPGGIVGRDAFVAYLSADGSDLLYGSYLGGSGEDLAIGATRLSAGNVVVIGQTDSDDFPVTQDAPFPTRAGAVDVFVATFDLDTGALVRATYFGGSGNDFPRDVVVEPDGSIVLLGDTASSDLPATEENGDGTLDGATDLFVARFSPIGEFEGARFVGGSGEESGGGIERGPNGEFWIVGSTTSPDIPVGQGEGIHGGYDALILGLSLDLLSLHSAAYLGGAEDDRGRAVAVTPDGLSVVAYGTTESDDFPVTPGAIEVTRRARDLFVTTFANGPLGISASTLFGTASSDSAFQVRTDESGAVVIAGSGLTGGMPATPGAADLVGHPACTPYCFSDAIVARLNATLTHVQYASYLASSNGDSARDLVGTVQVRATGTTGGADFPTTAGVYGEEVNLGLSSAGADAFAVGLDLTAAMPRISLSADEVSWDPLPGAEGYDVVRGDLHALREDRGASSRSVDLCVTESTPGTAVPMPETPMPGEAWWILVRAERTGTPTSYDAVAMSQRGTRDDGIAAASNRCD